MIKKLVLIIFSFLLYFNSATPSDLKIVYVNIDKIINQSNAGIKVSKELEILNNDNIKKFKQKEKKITDTEKNLIKQKNILSKEEFDIKVNKLKENVQNFRKEVDVSRKNLDKKKIDATNQILNTLNQILTEYSSKNSISLIIQKKNIVIGKTELDITGQILELVNAKIKSIKLK